MTEENSTGQDIGQIAVEELVEQMEARTPAPGGGSAASVAGALGAALLHMTASFSVDSEAEEYEEQEQRMEEIRTCSRNLLELAETDRKAYEQYQTLQRNNASDQEKREALLESTQVPLEMGACCEQLIHAFLDLSNHLKPSFQADVKTALQLIRVNWNAACDLASYNLDALPDGEKASSLRSQLNDRKTRMAELFQRVEPFD